MISTIVPLNRFIATGGWDRKLIIWQIIYSGQLIVGCSIYKIIDTEGAVLCAISFKSLIAYGGMGNRVILIDWRTNEIKQRLISS